VHIKVWSENLKGKDYLKDLGVDGRFNRIDLRVGWCGLD
jgi:hypothetical protein